MKGEWSEQTLPLEAHVGTSEVQPWGPLRGRVRAPSVGGRVCGPGDRASKPESFIGDDAIVHRGSPRGSDQDSADRGPRSSARTPKVCCTRIGRSRAERSWALAAGVRVPGRSSMEAIANGGKA
jgi:hypothetical protein